MGADAATCPNAPKPQPPAQNNGVCGGSANCVGAGTHVNVQDTNYSASGNAVFVKAEQVGIGGKVSGGVVDTNINTTTLAPGVQPGQGASATGQVNVQGGTANAEASAKVGVNGAQLKVGAEALLFKAGGTLNLSVGRVTLQLSASYQFGVAAKAGGSATVGPSGLPTSVGGSVSAAAGPLGASGSIKFGLTSALNSEQ